MSMFDHVSIGDKNGQIKCWGREGKNYDIYSQVPMINGYSTYSVKMQHYDGGGFLNVMNEILVSWTDEPIYFIVFDKWGEKLQVNIEERKSDVEEIIENKYEVE